MSNKHKNKGYATAKTLKEHNKGFHTTPRGHIGILHKENMCDYFTHHSGYPTYTIYVTYRINHGEDIEAVINRKII